MSTAHEYKTAALLCTRLPGRADYVKNMITGAARWWHNLLVVNAYFVPQTVVHPASPSGRLPAFDLFT
jgi:translation elongation factor EF-Tu-like GTPase